MVNKIMQNNTLCNNKRLLYDDKSVYGKKLTFYYDVNISDTHRNLYNLNENGKKVGASICYISKESFNEPDIEGHKVEILLSKDEFMFKKNNIKYEPTSITFHKEIKYNYYMDDDISFNEFYKKSKRNVYISSTTDNLLPFIVLLSMGCLIGYVVGSGIFIDNNKNIIYNKIKDLNIDDYEYVKALVDNKINYNNVELYKTYIKHMEVETDLSMKLYANQNETFKTYYKLNDKIRERLNNYILNKSDNKYIYAFVDLLKKNEY